MPYAATSTTTQCLRRSDRFAELAHYGVRADTVTSLWHYRTTDTAAVVEAAAYFNAATQLKVGDVILAVVNNGVGATPALKNYVVTQAISNAQANNVIALQTDTAG